MYRPRHFAMDDGAALAMAEGIGVGHLVTAREGLIESSFVPFLVERSDTNVIVRAHLAVGNTHHTSIGENTDAVLIVTGPDAYVSPNWYPSKVEHGKVVPTWNYSLVHLRGTVRVVDDRDARLAVVSALTDRHEASRDQPWSVTDAPSEYIESQLRAIVAVEMIVTAVEGKAKLSQNRSPADREGVRDALATGSPTERAVADEME